MVEVYVVVICKQMYHYVVTKEKEENCFFLKKVKVYEALCSKAYGIFKRKGQEKSLKLHFSLLKLLFSLLKLLFSLLKATFFLILSP